MDKGTVRNVELYSKNKFEKLDHLVGFIINFFTMRGHLNFKRFMPSVWCLEFFEVAATCFEYLCALILARIF